MLRRDSGKKVKFKSPVVTGLSPLPVTTICRFCALPNRSIPTAVSFWMKSPSPPAYVKRAFTANHFVLPIQIAHPARCCRDRLRAVEACERGSVGAWPNGTEAPGAVAVRLSVVSSLKYSHRRSTVNRKPFSAHIAAQSVFVDTARRISRKNRKHIASRIEFLLGGQRGTILHRAAVTGAHAKPALRKQRQLVILPAVSRVLRCSPFATVRPGLK